MSGIGTSRVVFCEKQWPKLSPGGGTLGIIMADYYLCRNCEVRLTRLPERRTVNDLGPCSNCGATDWTVIVELAGSASAASSASATLTVTPEFPKGQVIPVGPAVEHEIAHPVTITKEITDSVGITDGVESDLSPGFEPTVLTSPIQVWTLRALRSN